VGIYRQDLLHAFRLFHDEKNLLDGTNRRRMVAAAGHLAFGFPVKN
jgi:hypothetical protein